MREFIYLQQVEETGDSYPKPCLLEGGVTIAHIHYLINYMLRPSLQLLILFTAGLQNIGLHFHLARIAFSKNSPCRGYKSSATRPPISFKTDSSELVLMLPQCLWTSPTTVTYKGPCFPIYLL